jgi:hypothetical protein
MSKPTPADLAAVRKILYDPKRHQQLADDASSISVLMNLEDQSPNRVLTWWIPATGKLSEGVLEAAARCRSIAAAYEQMKQEMQHVAIPAQDKASIQEALGYVAGCWQARADAWGDERPPSDPAALAKAINVHLGNALAAAHDVEVYFKQEGA